MPLPHGERSTSPSAKIVNDTGERLYASFINIDLSYGTKAPVDLGEGTELFIRHAARVYARRFVEGFFVFDDAALPPDVHTAISSRAAYCGSSIISRTE